MPAGKFGQLLSRPPSCGSAAAAGRRTAPALRRGSPASSPSSAPSKSSAVQHIGKGRRDVIAGAGIELAASPRSLKRPARGCRPTSIRPHRRPGSSLAKSTASSIEPGPASPAGTAPARRAKAAPSVLPARRRGRHKAGSSACQTSSISPISTPPKISAGLLGQPRRGHPNPQAAGHQLQAAPSDRRRSSASSQPSISRWTSAARGRMRRASTTSDSSGGSRLAPGLRRPGQGHRLGQIADIVVGPGEQLRRPSAPRWPCG